MSVTKAQREKILYLARAQGWNTPTIAKKLGLTAEQVRNVRRNNDRRKGATLPTRAEYRDWRVDTATACDLHLRALQASGRRF